MEAIRFVQQFANPVLDQIFIALTMLGEETAFIIIFTIMFWCINKEYSYKLGLAYLLSAVINISVKETMRVPRPFGEEGIRYLRPETATGYSFPSGHTQSAAAYLTSLVLEYRRKWFSVASVILLGLIGLSRIYVGAHRPNEVIGGALLGIGWVFIYNRYYQHLEKIGKLRILVVLMALTMGGMLVIKDPDWFKTSGVIFSLVLGGILEAKYIGFEVKASLPQHIAKVAIGLLVALLIKSGLKALFPDILFLHFVRYVCLGLWITAGAPATFKLLFKGGGPARQADSVQQ